MPIMRSLSTAVAASGLPLERGGSSVVGRGRSDRTISVTNCDQKPSEYRNLLSTQNASLIPKQKKYPNAVMQ
jgi:hypothetical protein